jgi:hypothetical protein
MNFYDICKHVGARAINTTVQVGTGATGVTQLVAALQTTPSDMPVQHQIFLQKGQVVVTTGSAGKTWQLQDGAGTPVKEAQAMDMTTAGTKYTFDWGPGGYALTVNKDLNVSISAAAAAADITIEGYQLPYMAVNNGIPTVASVSPNTGSTAGGTAVAVFGTGLRKGATVAIGGVACTSVQWISPQELLCVTGAHGAGAVNCVVTNPSPNNSEVATGVNKFTYA